MKNWLLAFGYLYILIGCSTNSQVVKNKEVQKINFELTPNKVNEDSLQANSFYELKFACLELKTGNYIINNKEDYLSLISKRWKLWNCHKEQYPKIDFSKYTLVGIINSSGGSPAPNEKLEIKMANDTSKINYHITRYGSFMNFVQLQKWLLIQKKESDFIKINISKSRIDE